MTIDNEISMSSNNNNSHHIENGMNHHNLTTNEDMNLPPQQRASAARGRYAKFNGTMDVLLLEALRENNPFEAKHGTRLQMWQNIAAKIGQAAYSNPNAYSWHTCRDRVAALMKMYADGKVVKLYKRGTQEENAIKEAILRELHASGGQKLTKHTLLNGSVYVPKKNHAIATTSSISTSSNSKKRKFQLDDASNREVYTSGTDQSSSIESSLSNSSNNIILAHLMALREQVNRNGNSDATGQEFRTRILELMEQKLQHDMEYRAKDNELREQEIELQKQMLEYLQSK